MSSDLAATLLILGVIAFLLLVSFIIVRLNRGMMVKIAELTFANPLLGAVVTGGFFFIAFAIEHALHPGGCATRSCRKFQIFTLPGILISQIVGRYIQLNDEQAWQIAAGSGAILWAALYYLLDYFRRKKLAKEELAKKK
jgi:hypothetical protein